MNPGAILEELASISQHKDYSMGFKLVLIGNKSHMHPIHSVKVLCQDGSASLHC